MENIISGQDAVQPRYNFWVYILTNWKKTTLYVGRTNDLKQRLKEHYDNRGNSKTFTGKYYCYNLVYFEWHQYINNAMEREFSMKNWKREDKIRLIESINPNWKFLNREICGEWPPTYPGRAFIDLNENSNL